MMGPERMVLVEGALERRWHVMPRVDRVGQVCDAKVGVEFGEHGDTPEYSFKYT